MMFGRSRKASVENLCTVGVDKTPVRSHAQIRQHSHGRTTSPRRSSFHGSEREKGECQGRRTPPDDTPRKIKYATAPLIHHDPGRRSSTSSAPPSKPVPPPKSKNIPQPAYQKTFMVLLKGKDKDHKRRSTELTEMPPAISPKPCLGSPTTAGLPPPGPAFRQSQQNVNRPVVHTAPLQSYDPFQNAEPFHPPKVSHMRAAYHNDQ